jgi:hypothetical protein
VSALDIVEVRFAIERGAIRHGEWSRLVDAPTDERKNRNVKKTPHTLFYASVRIFFP